MLEVRVPGFGTLRIAECELEIIRPGHEDRAKARYVRGLGASRVACVGNGRNDRSMLRLARLGVAVVQAEGAAAETLAAADLVVHSIRDALDLFLQPRRLIASLRA
jgi:soluble P-type ATPase